MHRFYVPDAAADRPIVFSAEQAHQLATVLRLAPPARVAVFDGRGSEYEVQLVRVAHGHVEGRVIDRHPHRGEPSRRVILHQALLKGDRLEWVVQKAVEIGVARIALLVTARCVVRELAGTRLDRLRRIAVEAAEQSGRSVVPWVEAPHTLHTALEGLSGPAIVPWEEARNEPMGAALAHIDALGSAELALFIGPEGGLEPREVDGARLAGCHIVTLGPRILRAETAAVVALSLALSRDGTLT